MMPFISIIPERTIDAWTASEVIAFDFRARVWAPTPRSQAAQEPWDFAITSSRPGEKLFVLENKGLFDPAPANMTSLPSRAASTSSTGMVNGLF